MLCRFEYNGFPNPSYRPGKFELLIDGGIQAYTEPRPQLLMVSSGAPLLLLLLVALPFAALGAQGSGGTVLRQGCC